MSAEPDEFAPVRSWQSVISWIAAGVVLRAALGTLVPLFPDETYYWEWSRRLAPGYFDHPPGIAFVIASGTTLLGNTTAGVRFGPAVAALVMQLAAAAAANALGGVAAARRAAMLTTLLPIATLGLVLATPDAPLFAAVVLTLLCVDRALTHAPRTQKSTLWWSLAGASLGVALFSKYTAVLIAASMFVGCVLHPRLRARFAEPGPYLATVIAALCFAPVVWWNANNDWASFRFQLGHGFGSGAKGNILTRELELIGGQLALATPILAVLLAYATWRSMRESWKPRNIRAGAGTSQTHHSFPEQHVTLDERRFALAVMAMGPLLFFAFSATRRSVEPNWPALAYPGAILLLSSMPQLAQGKWWKRGLQLAAVLLAIACVQAWRPVLPLAPRKDPIARAYGWDQLAATVDSMTHDPFLNGAGNVWIAAERYQDASELAFNLPGQPEVLSLNIGGRANHYDLWRTAHGALKPGDALVASFDANPAGDDRARVVAGWFRSVHEGPVVALRRGTGEVAHRKVWMYRHPVNVPPPSTMPRGGAR